MLRINPEIGHYILINMGPSSKTAALPSTVNIKKNTQHSLMAKTNLDFNIVFRIEYIDKQGVNSS